MPSFKRSLLRGPYVSGNVARTLPEEVEGQAAPLEYGGDAGNGEGGAMLPLEEGEAKGWSRCRPGHAKGCPKQASPHRLCLLP